MIVTVPGWRLEGWARIAAVAIIGAIAATTVLLASPPAVIAAAVFIGMFWYGWANPALGIGIVAATIPLQDRVTITLGNAEPTMTQLTVLPLVAGWFAAWMTRRSAVSLTPPIVAWALFTATMALSVVNAVDRGAWTREVYRWVIAFALLVVAVHAVERFRDAIPALVGTSVGVLIATAESTRQVIGDDGPPSFSSGGIMRAYGFFGEPNPLAAYLEMSVLILAPLAIVCLRSSEVRIPVRVGLALVVMVGAGTLLLTQSRGGLLGFAAGATVIALFLAPWSRIVVLAGLVVVIPFVAITSPGQDALHRFSSSVATLRVDEQTTPENWSVHERVAHWRAGVSMTQAEPLTGIGAGNFDARYREYTEVWRFRIPRGHAHNNLIQVAAQTGLIGLVAYVALFFVAGARIARGVAPSHRARSRALALGALGVLVAVIVHGQFDYLHGLSLNLAFVIALALAEPAVSAARISENRAGASA